MKYAEEATRILLTLSTKFLLAANVTDYQEECYKPFRSPAWKRGKNVTSETNLEVDNTWKDLCHLLRYHVLVKKEVYPFTQVWNMYDELRRELGEEVTNSRSIDIKKRLKGEFGDKLTSVSSGKEVRQSKFLFSSDSNLSYEFIKACASGTSIPRSAAIKTTA